MLASCSTSPLGDAVRPSTGAATYYQESGEVVLKDTDYFAVKQYISDLEWCVN